MLTRLQGFSSQNDVIFPMEARLIIVIVQITPNRVVHVGSSRALAQLEQKGHCRVKCIFNSHQSSIVLASKILLSN